MMASKVLDLTTIGHALNELCVSFLGESQWEGVNKDQQEFLNWYSSHGDEITKLSDLEALASTDYTALNTFVTNRGFDPVFQPFQGIGVASILDTLVEWLVKGSLTTITQPRFPMVHYPAFSITPDNVDIYDAAGYIEPLVRLRTKTGHSLWMMKTHEHSSGLELNSTAQHLLIRTERRWTLRWHAGIVMPMIEMDASPDMSWMLGMKARSHSMGNFHVDQAFQKYKLRINEIGARIRIFTGMVMVASAAPTARRMVPYMFDTPFLGFFTQPGNDTLPIGVFYADTDSWKNTGGTLEELQ